eukprot:5064208-Amphidinium_carterae.1
MSYGLHIVPGFQNIGSLRASGGKHSRLVSLVRALTCGQADPNQKSSDGKNPIERAVEQDLGEFINLMCASQRMTTDDYQTSLRHRVVSYTNCKTTAKT